MGIDKKFLTRQITAADPEDSKSSVRFATTVPLAAYNRLNNTITMTANGALAAQDGVTPALSDDLLLTSDGAASGEDCGIWTITQLGDGSNPTILNRRADANANDLITSQMAVRVSEGLRFGGKLFVLTTPDPIVLNTTALDFQVIDDALGYPLSRVSDTHTVPVDQVMHYTEDLFLDDSADLRLEGDLVPVRDPENQSIKYIPRRTTRTVPENDVVFFTDLDVDGTLDAEGTVEELVHTGQQILDELSIIAPNAPYILGGMSPTGFLSPAQGRTLLDVYSQAATNAQINAAIDLIQVSPFAALALAAQPAGPSWNAVAGNLYQITSLGTIAVLPTPTLGACIGFINKVTAHLGGVGTQEVQSTAAVIYPGGTLSYTVQIGVLESTPEFYVWSDGTSWFVVGNTGSKGQLLFNLEEKTSNFAALPNSTYIYDTSTSITATLPLNPAHGDEVCFIGKHSLVETIWDFTIDAVSHNIYGYTGGAGTTMIVSGAGLVTHLKYNAVSSGTWHVVGGTGVVSRTSSSLTKLGLGTPKGGVATAVGFSALGSLSSGQANTAVGGYAARLVLNGSYNTAVGDTALFQNTAGSDNTAVGYEALYAALSSGHTAVGARALESLTTGVGSVAVGKDAARTVTTGEGTTAVGFEAYYYGNASHNTAIGYQSLYSAGVGSRNTGVGYRSIYMLSSGSDNVAVGYQALDALTVGSQNTGVGHDALGALVSGNNSTAVGYRALLLSNASDNTAVGAFALSANTTGVQNTAVGVNALDGITGGIQNTAVGYNALTNATGTANTNVAVGFNALPSVTTGDGNIGIGADSGSGISTGSLNISIGSSLLPAGVTNYGINIGNVYHSKNRTLGDVAFQSTITPPATTGAQTIDKPTGTVNFAAAATSLVVTNSLVTANSLVFAQIRTNDATAVLGAVVPAAGSFTIYMTTAPTSETSVGFLVISPV